RIAKDGEYSGAAEPGASPGFLSRVAEVGRAADDRAGRVPRELRSHGANEGAPALVTRIKCRIAVRKKRFLDDLVHHARDFCRIRPDIPQVYRTAGCIRTERVARQIDAYGAGDGVRHDERRRGEESRGHERMNPTVVIAVARDDGDSVQVAFP